jgi:hypothetical protein
MGASQSQVWRWENSRVHPSEVDTVKAQVARFGELPEKEARQPKAATPSKAELLHRVETVIEFIKATRGDKNVAKSALADGVLAILDPTDAPKA